MLYKKIIPLSLVVIATLHAAEVELIPITVESTVLTEVSENAQISADLAQALSGSVPSIDMNRRSGIANDILIRGQKRDNISVEVDGTRVQGACVNRMDPPISHVLTSQIDEIIVTEGPYNVEAFGTLSGGVEITTKKPTKEVAGEVDFGLGSWGYKKVGATVSGGNDILRLLVSASYENSDQYEDGDGNTIADQIDNYVPAGVHNTAKDSRFETSDRDMDAYTKKSIMTKMFITLADEHELRFSYTANRSDDVLYGNSKMDADYDDSNIYSVEYNVDNLTNLYKNFNIQYYYTDVEHPMSTRYRVGADYPGGAKTNHLTTHMKGLKLKNTLDLAGYKFLLGLDASDRSWDGNYYNTKTHQALPAGNSKSLDNAVTTNNAIFAKLENTFGNFEVSTGARYDNSRVVHDTLNSNTYNSLSANIVSTYNINSQNKVFLGYGVASRIPDARELYFRGAMGNWQGTNNLKQTKNNEIDLGYELNNDSFKVKVKTFYSMLEDYIYFNKSNTGKIGMMTVPENSFENIDATIYGAELTASYFATDDISIDMGASYKVGEKDEAMSNQDDKDLADIAPLRGNIGVNYEYRNNSMATVEVQASDTWDKYDADNGEQQLDKWAILNMKVKHAVDKHTEITIGINNVFDETYAVSNTYSDLTLLTGGSVYDIMLMNEAGRYFYTNLNFKF